jgi:thymidylate synthase
MHSYLGLLHKIIGKGIDKNPFRVRENKQLDNGTIGLPNLIFSHDMQDGFPLLTTKKMAFRSICVELEGFIKGITDKAWYQQRGCKIWDEWCNPKAAEEFYATNYTLPYLLEQRQAKEEGWVEFDSNEPPKYESVRPLIQQSVDDLGPIYGYQWRKFNTPYPDGFSTKDNDQLKNIVETLTNKPTDRRMVCSAWNPNQIDEMALPPCHLMWIATVYGDSLNLCWTQRSCDLFLGVPFNIASYALLLELLAKHAGLKAGNLTGVLVDCHIYKNQIEQAKEQLGRLPHSLPAIEFTHDNFWDWDHTKVKLVGYISHPPIKAEVTV